MLVSKVAINPHLQYSYNSESLSIIFWNIYSPIRMDLQIQYKPTQLWFHFSVARACTIFTPGFWCVNFTLIDYVYKQQKATKSRNLLFEVQNIWNNNVFKHFWFWYIYIYVLWVSLSSTLIRIFSKRLQDVNYVYSVITSWPCRISLNFTWLLSLQHFQVFVCSYLKHDKFSVCAYTLHY